MQVQKFMEFFAGKVWFFQISLVETRAGQFSQGFDGCLSDLFPYIQVSKHNKARNVVVKGIG